MVVSTLDGFKAEAEGLLEGAAQIEPDNSSAGSRISTAYEKKKTASIELKLKEAVRRAPKKFDTHHSLGEFYIQQGNLAAAIPYLEKAQQIDPTHYVNSYDLALAYLQTGNLRQARQQIQSIPKWNDKAELHNLLGEVEEKTGNLVAAAEAYQHATQLEETEKHLFDFGNVLLKLGTYGEAEQVFRYGLGKYSRSAKLRIGLGIVEYSRGQYSEAVKSLCEAADIEPSDHRPYLFLGEMHGVSPEMADEINKRLAQFVAFHPKNALAHYHYALNLWKGQRGPDRQIDLDQIEALLKTAVTLDPRLAQAQFQLGILYSEQHRYPEAILVLRQAIRLQPDLVEAHYRLGQLYQRSGQQALAAQEMEIFKRLKDQKSEQSRPQ